MAKNSNNMDGMMDPEDMTDLGTESPGIAGPDENPEDVQPETSYPSIHLTLDEPLDLPAGEFSFVAVGNSRAKVSTTRPRTASTLTISKSWP